MNDALMKVELTAKAARWVKAEIAAGNFASAEDAVRYAIEMTRCVLDHAKRAASPPMSQTVSRGSGEHSGASPFAGLD
jgi:Arc/MetJ-type ribon-helix-helix transcriptional regulator